MASKWARLVCQTAHPFWRQRERDGSLDLDLQAAWLGELPELGKAACYFLVS